MYYIISSINTGDTARIINVTSIYGQTFFNFFSFCFLERSEFIASALIGLITIEGIISIIYYKKTTLVRIIGLLTFVFSPVTIMLIISNTTKNNELLFLILGWGLSCSRTASMMTMYFTNLIVTNDMSRSFIDMDYENDNIIV